MPKPRYAIVMPQASVQGGAELCLLEVLRSPAGQTIDWHVLFLRDGPLIGMCRDLGAQTALFPINRTREFHKTLLTAFKIARHCRAHRIDALIGWLSAGQVYAGLASLLGGPRNAWHQMGTPYKTNLLDSTAGRLPTRGIVACSKQLAEIQRALSPNARIEVCYLGAQLGRFNPDILPPPADARRKLGLPADGPLIGIVGRLQPWKGMHVLIDALPKVRTKHPDARAVIVGGPFGDDTSYPEKLRAQADALGIADAVTFAGPQDNVPEWVQAMDIFVHASDNEPFGIVIIEGMALGKPTVAADSGGPREIIVPEKQGLLTPFGDSDALAAALVRYLDDPAWAATVGAAARVRAQEFSSEHYAGNFLATLETLLK